MDQVQADVLQLAGDLFLQNRAMGNEFLITEAAGRKEVLRGAEGHGRKCFSLTGAWLTQCRSSCVPPTVPEALVGVLGKRAK